MGQTPDSRRDTAVPAGEPRERPSRRSHFRPRTGAGWIAVAGFLALFALAQPPLLYWVANRIEPRILGLPFLYAWLLGVYTMQIAVLIWARLRNL